MRPRRVTSAGGARGSGRFAGALGGRVTHYNGTIGYSGGPAKQRAFGGAGDAAAVLASSRDAVVEWFLLGALDDAVLSEGSTFGQTAWARALPRRAVEVGNSDLRCLRRWGDDPDAVIDRECCARHAAAAAAAGGAGGVCPGSCRIFPPPPPGAA